MGKASRAAALFLILGSAACTRESVLGVERPDRNYWAGYYHDAGYVLSAPLRTDNAGWLKVGGFAGVSALALSRDESIREALQAARSEGGDALAHFADPLGRVEYVLPGLALAYGLGAAFDDPTLEEASLLGAESVVMANLIASGLKSAFGRARPEEEGGPDDWKPFSGEHSFPSGHATTAFAVATVFDLEYGNRWVSVLAYSLAGLVGFSRLNEDSHWTSDVLVGAAIGVLTARGVFSSRLCVTW